MTALLPQRAQPAGRMPLLCGLGAALLLGVAGGFAPRAVLHGWLVAFATFAGLPLGALAWRAIHRLTGGRWGALAEPGLARLEAALPLLLLYWLPLGLGLRLVYPWAADPARAAPGVAALYLNGVAFWLRSLVGLLVLWLLGRFWRSGELAAALRLLVYAVFMNFVAFDWLLSVEPRFESSAFGVEVIVGQLIAAMAYVALTLDVRQDDKAVADIGALLLATALGETYLLLMTFIIDWYGDLPDQAAWYLRRTRHGWRVLAVAGLFVGLVGPIVALLFGRLRDTAGPLRFLGAALLLGVLLQNIWRVAPATEAGAGLATLPALFAMAALAAGLVPARPRGTEHGRHVD